MKKVSVLFICAFMLLAIAGLFACRPGAAAVSGDTWTDTLAGYAYSITPVPGKTTRGSEELFSLARGSVFTVSETGFVLEIWTITDFDYGEMGEHTIEGPIFSGTTYTFNEPGLYTIYFMRGSRYVTVTAVEVN